MAEPYIWTADKMITWKRAKYVAYKLFRDEFHEGDCKSEIYREGQPCHACAEANARWSERIIEVRAVMLEAFGDPDVAARIRKTTVIE